MSEIFYPQLTACDRTWLDRDHHARLERQVLGDQTRVVHVHPQIVTDVVRTEPLHRLTETTGHRSVQKGVQRSQVSVQKGVQGSQVSAEGHPEVTGQCAEGCPEVTGQCAEGRPEVTGQCRRVSRGHRSVQKPSQQFTWAELWQKFGCLGLAWVCPL